MDETHAFLEAVTGRITDTEIDLHNGNPRKRIELWSRTEPLTLFGAAMSARSWEAILPVFNKIGEEFSNCTAYENEIIAAQASGDFAYTVAYEHVTCSIRDQEPASYVLRVTTVFRREDGDWKVVHRHGDALAGEAAAGRLSRSQS